MLSFKPAAGNKHSLKVIIRGSFKMFPESLNFRKIQNIAIVLVTFLQNSLTLQLPTSASNCKITGNILGSHFVKSFSALPSHS